MFLDNEQNILEEIQSFKDNVLLYNGNSFNKKILRCITDLDNLTSNNAHDALPPDFYSEKNNIMFDVMRVNDSEVRKGYNPVMIRERKAEKDLKQSGFLDSFGAETESIILTENEKDVGEEHQYKYYKKQCQNTIKEHIKEGKLKIWQTEHPTIKYKGLFIYDETECYFEGNVFKNPHAISENDYVFLWTPPLIVHKPWEDEQLISSVYNAKIDFVIWAAPYKRYSTIVKKNNINYPRLVILDVRYSRNTFYKYNYNKLVVS